MVTKYEDGFMETNFITATVSVNSTLTNDISTPAPTWKYEGHTFTYPTTYYSFIGLDVATATTIPPPAATGEVQYIGDDWWALSINDNFCPFKSSAETVVFPQVDIDHMTYNDTTWFGGSDFELAADQTC